MHVFLQRFAKAGGVVLLDEIFGRKLGRETLRFLTGHPPEELLELDVEKRQEDRLSSIQIQNTVPLSVLLDKYPALRDALQQMPHEAAQHPFFMFLSLLSNRHDLEALEHLLTLGLELADTSSPEQINMICLVLMRGLGSLDLDGFSYDTARRYRAICLSMQSLVVCSGVKVPSLVRTILRARALARRFNDTRHLALFDLLVGSINVSNTPEHNNPKFHAIMARGMTAVEKLADPELLTQAAPYLGIYYFIEGKYQQATNQFSLASSYLQKSGQKMLEMFYLRHWSFAASCKGDFDFAASLLLSRLRRLSPRSDNQLARSLRGQLGALYLRMGLLDKAIEQLDIAQIGISPGSNIVSWVTNCRHLAYYHLLCGNLTAGYHVLRAALEEAQTQGYSRPVYLGSTLLELLCAFTEAGLPPLGCYSTEEELHICLNGPNRLLRGSASRLYGNILLKQGRREEAKAYYEQSLEILKSIGAQLELAKSHLDLARMYLHLEEKERALVHVLEAWPMYEYLKNTLWPNELLHIVPAYLLEQTRPGLSRETLLDRYRDLFIPYKNLRNSESTLETFAQSLLAESCRILGARQGFLFQAKYPHAPIRLMAYSGEDAPEAGSTGYISLPELMNLVMEGTPLILDNLHGMATDAASSGMLVGIPADCSPDGVYALCHDGLLDPEVRSVLDEDLLMLIGKIIARELGRVSSFLSKGRPSGQVSDLEGQPLNEIICASPRMESFLAQVDKAAPTDAPVLISGESGVGKEMVAWRVHELSRRKGRMVVINSASLSDELFESELFGHEKGAFTGAVSSKPGMMESAHNGTLFLDEITETTPRAQAKLLRVLQEHRFYRVGGTQPISVNFRLITASNRDVQAAVRQGQFRQDLYYRIGVINLAVPPLRERPEDILAIARYYLNFYARWHDLPCPGDFSPEIYGEFLRYVWPGNVRELRNIVEQAVVLSNGLTVSIPDIITAPAVHSREWSVQEAAEFGIAMGPNTFAPGEPGLNACLSNFPSMAEFERRYLKLVLDKCGWKIEGRRGALETLQMNRSTLYNKIKKYGLR